MTSRCRLLAFTLSVAIFGTSTVAATPPHVPPLTEPATHQEIPGKMIWANLVTPDLKAAERFYGGLFGWTFQDVAGAHAYALALLQGMPVAGIAQRTIAPGKQRQPAWHIFLSVRDAGTAVSAATARGGRLLAPLRDYPDRGRAAVLADPQGAVFGILQSQSGDPVDALAPPGAFIWSTLLTSDPNAGAAFYQDLFGYQVFDASARPGMQHLVLASADYARASLNPLPADGRRHPHWLAFVRVRQVAPVLQQAQSLGARVLVPAHMDRHGGEIAVIADPSGAPIGLLEWSETRSPGESP